MGIFCKHGYIRDCPNGCADSDFIPGISGETCPTIGVQSLVPKDRRDEDVQWRVNPDTGHREKGYFNHGLGEWCFGVKDTERKCAARGFEIIGSR
jgi:hypothetical protein